MKPSRTVTRKRRRKCRSCQQSFVPKRIDQRFCSGACRQRACRIRQEQTDFQREIDKARVRYWKLVYEWAVARDVDVSQILTDQAVYVDADGNVFRGFPGSNGDFLGRINPNHPGWASWGLEAAGSPFNPPPERLAERAARRKRKGK